MAEKSRGQASDRPSPFDLDLDEEITVSLPTADDGPSDHWDLADELRGRRAYGRLGFDLEDDHSLARAVGAVDRGGHDPRAGTTDAHDSLRAWGPAS